MLITLIKSYVTCSMATLPHVRKAVSLLTNALKQFSTTLQPSNLLQNTVKNNRTVKCTTCRNFQCSAKRWDLSEFFDDKKHYTKDRKTGRPWRRDELRIKSNEDLHKLWYVLLKERNMLMTMNQEYKRHIENMPNSERFEKVEESMNNILMVIEERNEAVNVLERGTTGRKDQVLVRNVVGVPTYRIPQEHLVPQHMNKVYRLLHRKYEPWMFKHLKLYDEKKREKRRKLRRELHEVRKYYKKEYPDLSEEDLEYGIEQYRRSCKYGLFDYEKLQND